VFEDKKGISQKKTTLREERGIPVRGKGKKGSCVREEIKWFKKV